ncbi:MAG: TolC family outer membrane protein [Alphaproteobacteria bacterium]
MPIGALFAVSPVAAQTLEEALVQTYRENPTLEAERAGLRATDEGVPQALSNWRPTVEINGSYGRNDTSSDLANGTSTDTLRHPRDIELEITQNIFRGFRTVAETSQARNLVAAGRASLISTEQSVLLDAVTAYADVVQTQAVVRLRESNVRVLQRQLEATQDRFRVGELTRTDVAQAESRLARAKADLVGAQGSLDSARAQYREIIGSDPPNLVTPGVPGALPVSEDQAREQALTNNPGVVAAEFNERAARDSIDLSAGKFYPTVSVTGSATRDADVSGSNIDRTIVSLVANLTMPLYQAGDVSSQVREAKQTASERMSLLAEARRSAAQTATAAWSDLSAARASIASFEAEVKAQEVAYDGVQQEANVGSRTVLDVLDAEQELLNARVNLVGARRDEVVNAYELLAAIGRMTAQDLGLPVDYYDPTRNYEAVEDKWFGTDIGK